MELEPFVQHNSDDHIRNISLGYLTKLLQKMGLHDKIDLISEYAENNDSETIDVSDVFEQLRWNEPDPKQIGYWRVPSNKQERHRGEVEPGGTGAPRARR